MIYYSYEIRKKMPDAVDGVLQNYFKGMGWGVSCALFDKEGIPELITIDMVVGDVAGKQTWTHYANIQRTEKEGKWYWEINEQFKGKNGDEMWIYGRFTLMSIAVRNLRTKGTSVNGRKPIEIYV